MKPETLPDHRIRRQIANSNERRRMANINAALRTLREVLPSSIRENAKLSKAVILQETVKYILHLEEDKSKLSKDVESLKLQLVEIQNASRSLSSESSGVHSIPPSPNHPEIDIVKASMNKNLNEAIEPDKTSEALVEVQRENLELQFLYEQEKRHRYALEKLLTVLRAGEISQKENQNQEILMSKPGTFIKIINETPNCVTVSNNVETETIHFLGHEAFFSSNHQTHNSSSLPKPLESEAPVPTQATDTLLTMSFISSQSKSTEPSIAENTVPAASNVILSPEANIYYRNSGGHDHDMLQDFAPETTSTPCTLVSNSANQLLTANPFQNKKKRGRPRKVNLNHLQNLET